MKEEVSTTTPSIADGELTDDVLPDIVDVLAKFAFSKILKSTKAIPSSFLKLCYLYKRLSSAQSKYGSWTKPVESYDEMFDIRDVLYRKHAGDNREGV